MSAKGELRWKLLMETEEARMKRTPFEDVSTISWLERVREV